MQPASASSQPPAKLSHLPNAALILSGSLLVPRLVGLLARVAMRSRCDPGSSPGRADPPSGPLPPLDGRRSFAGAQHLPALRAHQHSSLDLGCLLLLCLATCCCCASPRAMLTALRVPTCPCDLGTGDASSKSQNQEWPFPGFSLFAVLSRIVCVCVCVCGRVGALRECMQHGSV